MSSNSIIFDKNALILRNNLNFASRGLSKSLQRLSTGFKVVSAKDDAAGVVIIDKMAVKDDGIKIANNNIQNSSCMLNVAQGSYDNIISLLTNLRDLSLKASDESYDDNARKAFQVEADELLDELQRIKVETKYNNIKLFDNYEEKTSNSNNITSNTTPPPTEGEPLLLAASFAVSDPISLASFSLSQNNEEIQALAATPMLMSLGEEPEYYSGAFDIGANEQNVEVEICGVIYTVSNLKDYEQCLSWKKRNRNRTNYFNL